VIEPLQRSAWFDRQSLRALRRSESKDRSKQVRLAVAKALNILEAGRIPDPEITRQNDTAMEPSI